MSRPTGWFPMRERSVVAVGLAVLAGPVSLFLAILLDSADATDWLPGAPENVLVIAGLVALGLGAWIAYLVGQRQPTVLAIAALVGLAALALSYVGFQQIALANQGPHDTVMEDGGDPSPGGHDTVQDTRASACWEEPGLYTDLSVAEDRPGVDAARQDGEGLPIDPAALPEGWDGTRVSHLRWHPPSKHNESHAKDRFLVTQTRNLTAGLTDDFTHEEKRAYFLEFAANVTRANQTTLEAWADRFMASEQPWDGRSSDTRTSWDPGFQRYEVHIREDVLAIGDVVANLSEPRDRFRTVGQAEIVDAPWYLTLDVPEKTIKASWSLGTRAEISVDPRDLALYTYKSYVDFSQPWDRDGDPPPTPEEAFSQLRELGEMAPYDGPIRWDKDQVDPEPLRC